MAKNKNKQKQKTSGVFKVAGHKALKAKGKAKPVATNLKKLNFKTKDQIAKSNEQLKSIQSLVTVNQQKSKLPSITVIKSNPKYEQLAAVDMEGAVRDLEKLGQ